MKNDFFVRSRRDRAARQDAGIVYQPKPEALAKCICYALAPAGEALLREYEAACRTSVDSVR